MKTNNMFLWKVYRLESGDYGGPITPLFHCYVYGNADDLKKNRFAIDVVLERMPIEDAAERLAAIEQEKWELNNEKISLEEALNEALNDIGWVKADDKTAGV